MGLRSAMAVKSVELAPDGTVGGGTGTASGVFVTKESLTFPGSAALVAFLLQLAEFQFDGAKTSFSWAFGVSLVIGTFIYSQSLTKDMSSREKASAAFIALINVLVLTGAGLGLGSASSDNAVEVA